MLGFVVAPFLGIATGLFPIDTEASAFFSLLTLKGVPDLAILSAASGFLAPALFRRGRGLRVALYAANALLAWLVAVSIALPPLLLAPWLRPALAQGVGAALTLLLFGLALAKTPATDAVGKIAARSSPHASCPPASRGR